jgi:anti-anti-sigma factor
MMMSDDAGQADDPLNMNLKEDAARVHHEAAGDVTVFVVENENVYPKQSQDIASAIRGAILAADAPKVLIDLSQVQFICSAFIGRIIELHKLAEERGGVIKLCVTGEHVAYTMKLVKLNNIIPIGGNRQELLDSF